MQSGASEIGKLPASTTLVNLPRFFHNPWTGDGIFSSRQRFVTQPNAGEGHRNPCFPSLSGRFQDQHWYPVPSGPFPIWGRHIRLQPRSWCFRGCWRGSCQDSEEYYPGPVPRQDGPQSPPGNFLQTLQYAGQYTGLRLGMKIVLDSGKRGIVSGRARHWHPLPRRYFMALTILRKPVLRGLPIRTCSGGNEAINSHLPSVRLYCMWLFVHLNFFQATLL